MVAGSLGCGEYGICSDDIRPVSPRVVFGSLAQLNALFWPHLTEDDGRGKEGVVRRVCACGPAGIPIELEGGVVRLLYV